VRPIRIAGAKGTLHAIEVDARRALDRWLAERRKALERIALRGTWLDEEDVTRLLRMSLPGIDEIAALLEIARFGRSGRFDLIVVDTAPTGHTLRMLAMPATLLAVARVFDRMQAKHRVLVEALRGAWRPDADDALIQEIAGEARDLASMLRDPSRVRMSWVTLPEPMAVEETKDAAAALQEQGIALTEVIVNRVTPPPPSRCAWCDARRAFESAALRQLAALSVRLLPSRETEPTGLRALLSVAAALQSGAASVLSEKEAASFRPVRAKVASWSRTGDQREAASFRRKVAAPFMAELVLFGGKGGVGKTTCAAGAAIAAARAEPGRRVLLISTDPAHSLADAVGVPLGDAARRLPGGPPNLRVRELDAAAGFARVRDRYHAAIDAMFDRFSRGALDVAQDRSVMQELINLAPPGIDELAAVIEVVDALDEDADGQAADLVIIDTAPSGHALRLLEMPALVQDWAKALMSILLKYQSVTGVGELGAVLLKLSKGLGRLKTILADRDRTQFIVVTRAAALPRAETVRLLKKLTKLGMHTPAIIVNATGGGTCTRCRRQRARETREITKLQTDAGTVGRAKRAIVATPATVPPPHGVASIERWRAAWRTRGFGR
jgi:arsenite/tail-anchored protein-transporting ATPase